MVERTLRRNHLEPPFLDNILDDWRKSAGVKTPILYSNIMDKTKNVFAIFTIENPDKFIGKKGKMHYKYTSLIMELYPHIEVVNFIQITKGGYLS